MNFENTQVWGFEHDEFINTDGNSTFKDAQSAWQS